MSTSPDQVRRRMAAANPAPVGVEPPGDVLTADALLAVIDERSGDMAQRLDTPERNTTVTTRRIRRNWAAAFAAGFALVLIVGLSFGLVIRAGDPFDVVESVTTSSAETPTTVPPPTTSIPTVESTVPPTVGEEPPPEADALVSVEPTIEPAAISTTASATISGPVVESNVVPVPGELSPWVETKLTASDGFTADTFGFTVAADGDRIVVSAPHRNEGGAYAGAVYVFDSDGVGGWNETKLVASDGSGGEGFGMAVAVEGDRVVVGAPGDLDNRGSAYVLDRKSDGTWIETKLTASDGARDDAFGSSVAVDGDRVVVGAGGADDRTGAVYVFDSDGGDGWTATKLTASDGAPKTYFGFWADGRRGMPVAADAGRIVVGSRSSFGETGVYVYEPDGAGGWVETKLAEFGFGVNIDGDRVVISGESAVHVFEPDGAGGWTETRVMISDRTDGDPVLRMTQSEGLPVAAADGRIVFASFPINTEFVSTATGSVDPAEQMGPVYVFDPEGNDEWTETNLNVPTHNQIIGFVFAVAASGDRVVVGALGITGGSQGAAYVYEHTQN